MLDNSQRRPIKSKNKHNKTKTYYIIKPRYDVKDKQIALKTKQNMIQMCVMKPTEYNFKEIQL